jgi:hypothetical protein
VQRLQAQLSALPIWQTAPALKQWSALPSESLVRLPLWQFELMGKLLDAESPHD